MKQKLVTMNLQNKAVTLLAAILFLILGMNTAVLTGVASRKYTKAMLTKSSLIGEGIEKELGKANYALHWNCVARPSNILMACVGD